MILGNEKYDVFLSFGRLICFYMNDHKFSSLWMKCITFKSNPLLRGCQFFVGYSVIFIPTVITILVKDHRPWLFAAVAGSFPIDLLDVFKEHAWPRVCTYSLSRSENLVWDWCERGLHVLLFGMTNYQEGVSPDHHIWIQGLCVLCSVTFSYLGFDGLVTHLIGFRGL